MNVSGSRTPNGSNLNTKPNEASAQRAAFKEAVLKKAREHGKIKNPNSQSPKESFPALATGNSKSRGKRKRGGKGKKSQDTVEGFKVTIRLLPPNLDGERFWETVHDYVKNELIYCRYYTKGHYSTKPFKTPTYSRAYISFKDAKIADEFVRTFKSQTFEDDKESLVPQFTDSLFGQMPKMSGDEPQKKQNNSKNAITSLQDHPSFRLFLNVQNNEMEKPATYVLKPKVINRLLKNNYDFRFLKKGGVRDTESNGGSDKPKNILKNKKNKKDEEKPASDKSSSRKKDGSKKSKDRSSKGKKDKSKDTTSKQSEQKKIDSSSTENTAQSSDKQSKQSDDKIKNKKPRAKKPAKKEQDKQSQQQPQDSSKASISNSPEMKKPVKQQKPKQQKSKAKEGAKSNGNENQNNVNPPKDKDSKGNTEGSKPKPKAMLLKRDPSSDPSTPATPKVVLMKRNTHDN